jgi:hypothetical protein
MLNEESAQIMPSQDVEELRSRIDKVADIIVHFSKTQKQTEKTVKQELEEILEDAERLKINREAIRRMLREAFNTRTISESYLRRLLPDEYKYDAKTRFDYRVKQKLEQQQTTDYSNEVNKQIPDVAGQEGLWTAIGILEMSRNQIPLKITVNQNERFRLTRYMQYIENIGNLKVCTN